MLILETVIVPFDFSKRCRLAAEHAAKLADRFNAKLVFLHVIPYSNYEYVAFEGGAYVGAAWPSETFVRGKLDEQVKAVLDTHGNNLDVETIVDKGDPPSKIEEAAARFPAPILVMPTHGFGPFRRFVLGSVTTKILHDVPCPVYTGAHLDDSPIFSTGEARHVACAIDLREHSQAILTWAWDYTQRWSADLTVVHAVKRADSPDLTQRLEAGAGQDARALMTKVGCQGDLRIGADSANAFVPQAIRESGADVLLIGRSLERAGLGRLREHAYNLIRESPCPVISV